MADNVPQFGQGQDAYLSQQDAGDLLAKTRSSLVNQFPYLANHPQFDSELNDAFSKFNQEQLQRGNGLEESFNKTILPTIQKWQAQGPRDTENEMQREDAVANRMRASGAASALDVPSMFPMLTGEKSPYRTEWETRMNHDVNSASRTPRLSATQAARKQFLQDELKKQWQSDALPGMKPDVAAEKKITDELSSMESAPASPAASALTHQSLPVPGGSSAQNPQPSTPEFEGTGIFQDWQPHGLRPDSVIEIGGNTIRAKTNPQTSELSTPPDSGSAASALGGQSLDHGPSSLLRNNVSPVDLGSLVGKTAPAAKKADIANRMAVDHPEWTRDQIIAAVNSQFTASR